MSDPIKIFICYKRFTSIEQDGEPVEMVNTQASTLHSILSKDAERYNPWFDKAEIRTGVVWEKQIYKRILISDAFVVVVIPGTSKSMWVQREIATAKALGITILPIGVDIPRDQLEAELKELAINHIQGKVIQNLADHSLNALLAQIGKDLDDALTETKNGQDELRAVLASRNKEPKAPDNQKAATFIIERNNRTYNLHIASGDVSLVSGIDVLVNSENDYMQMARFFDGTTVSSTLRSRGANVIDGKYEDTIQKELDWQLRNWGRPVQAGRVFATSAGGPGSELFTNNGARYILHVAAVQAVEARKTIIPFTQSNHIESCVRNCLNEILKINHQRGIISPPDTEQRKQQEELAEKGDPTIRSVIFPLFGTGKGGSDPADVLDPMLSTLTKFLERNDELAANLTDIYISAYKEQDVKTVTEFLKARFKSA